MFMFIDTHCHLEKEYYNDISKVINDSFNNNVKKLIVSGCEKEKIDEVVELIGKYDNIYATVGYHPDQASIILDSDIDKLKELLKNKKIVGVGEIGLDYHYGKDNKDKQIELFRKQLKLASDAKIPVVIHTRDATKDTIDILKEYNVSGVIHCFGGSLEVANIYINMGYKLGIGGVVTFKNSKLKEVLKNISINDIVLETDSPYLAPVPYRGKQNSPEYIPIIAEFIADIYGIKLEEVGNITSNTASSIYKI